MRRMEKITGRSDDMIILRGVNVFPTQIEEIMLRTPASPRTSSWCGDAAIGSTPYRPGRGPPGLHHRTPRGGCT